MKFNLAAFEPRSFENDVASGEVVQPDGQRQQAFEAKGHWFNAPIWNFNDDKLKFNTNKVDNYYEYYGSSSAFLPVYQFSQESFVLDEVLFLDGSFPPAKHAADFLHPLLKIV
jgi:hypothetical protein